MSEASIPWGNEAEIFIIAISEGKNNFSWHFRGKRNFVHFSGKEILEHERLGDVFRGKLTYLREKGKKCNI